MAGASGQSSSDLRGGSDSADGQRGSGEARGSRVAGEAGTGRQGTKTGLKSPCGEHGRPSWYTNADLGWISAPARQRAFVAVHIRTKLAGVPGKLLSACGILAPAMVRPGDREHRLSATGGGRRRVRPELAMRLSLS